MAEHTPDENLLEIEVAYARPDEQIVLKLTVPAGTTLEQAVHQSGLLARFPEIKQPELKLGVFGVVYMPQKCVGDGDRVEIYRPLLHDPKDARRRRALNKP